MIASKKLGLGKAQLYARAFYRDGSAARSCGKLVSIDPPAPLPAKKTTDDNKEESLQVFCMMSIIRIKNWLSRN